MRRAYVVLGQLDNGELDRVYAVCHSMERADELAFQAESEDPDIQYNYYEAIEEDD
jgi:hypothetical protein